MLTVKEQLAKNFINALGWKTKQKYLIIESDDWGAIRVPSRDVYEKLKAADISVDKFHFDKYDSLESEEDLNALFEVLFSCNDKYGNHPIITAYYVVANPNFEKIEATNRREYHYEDINKTFNRSEHTSSVMKRVEEGIKKKIFIPQFHGREHIHVKRWMEAINSNSKKEQLAFNLRAIISSKPTFFDQSYKYDYFKGFDYITTIEQQDIESIHRDGLHLFKEIFGMRSLTFTAQGGAWGNHLLKILNDEGVRLIGGQQMHPDGKGGYKRINKTWGTKNKLGQLHWRRNCMFEPARNQNFDWVGKCMAEIEIAFRWGKPAVISSHRENFIGSIFEDNRTESLKKLDQLLKKILIRWPDVKFISSPQLAEIMLQSK